MGNWFSGLPSKIRWSFIGGGTLLSTFADKLPTLLQDVGLYAGLALLAYGLFATLWHLLKQRGVSLLPSLLISGGVFLIFAGVMMHVLQPKGVVARAVPPPDIIVNRPKPTAIEATKGRVTFDYSTNNSIVSVGDGDCRFRISFSKASNTAIYMYTQKHSRKTNIKRLARVKGAGAGSILRFENFDSSSDVYQIRLGEHFLAENNKGCFMQGKIISLKDDTRGADHDEVVFDFEINTQGNAEFAAL